MNRQVSLGFGGTILIFQILLAVYVITHKGISPTRALRACVRASVVFLDCRISIYFKIFSVFLELHFILNSLNMIL